MSNRGDSTSGGDIDSPVHTSSHVRTDLAMEAHELWRESADETTELLGVEATEQTRGNFKVTTVRITNEDGARELAKPIGNYVTFEFDALLRREENAFRDAVEILAQELREILPLEWGSSVLVAGLGNAAITPDALGPEAIKHVMVTRHLKERVPEHFAAFREVSAIQSGVLGSTGMESADLITAVSRSLRPGAVIVIDALASRSMDRLCRTLQIADTGIVPGSGVGNSRSAINRESLGVPVVAIGVPTVVDAATVLYEMLEEAGIDSRETEKLRRSGGMIVTPRDIDKSVRDVAKLIGYALNLALHEDLTLEDVDMFLS